MLQPAFIKENGYRVYGDEELAKLIEISIDDNEAVDNGTETTYDAGILSEANHHIKVVALDNQGEVLDSSSTTLGVQSSTFNVTFLI